MALEDKIRTKTLGIIAQVFEVSATELKPDTNLDTELGADSLQYVALMAAFEEEFEVMVPFAEMRREPTVEGIIRLIIKLRKG